MPVTRPLLSCSPFLSFQSALRASGQSCAQCPSFLHSLPLVSIRLTRLWTILCPVSMVLGQPALRAARKVMFTPRTQLCRLRCRSCCFNLYNSQLHLSPPLSLALLVLVHSASRAAVVLDGETVEVGANFNASS